MGAAPRETLGSDVSLQGAAAKAGLASGGHTKKGSTGCSPGVKAGKRLGKVRICNPLFSAMPA